MAAAPRRDAGTSKGRPGIATPVEVAPWQKLSASSSPHPPFYASNNIMAGIFEQPRNAGTLCTS